MPELSHRKQKTAPEEKAKAAEEAPKAASRTSTKESTATPSAPVAGPATTAKKSEGVAVTPQQDFKYTWYLANVSEKIKQNWNPPPDSKDAKARVMFKVNRSGWVIDVQLDGEHSNGSFPFKQAAIRAIKASNPFPPLPEEYFKQALEFTVDLIPEE